MSENNNVPDGVPPSLVAALAAVQAELPDVNKSRTVEVENKAGEFQYSFDYADLFEISRKILPLLSRHGLAWMAKPTLVEGKMALVYKLMHVSGEVEEGVYPLVHGGTAQQLGSAITFARRYCLCSVVGVAPKEDDDDGAAASRPVTAQRRARPQPNGDGGQPVQRARAAAPPLPGEQGYDRAAPNGRAATRPQVNKILAMFDKHGIKDRAERLNICSRLVHRTLGSANDMTNDDVTAVVEAIEGVEQSGQPFRQWLVQLFQSTEDEAAAFAEPVDDGVPEPPPGVGVSPEEQAALFADTGRPAPSTAGGMR